MTVAALVDDPPEHEREHRPDQRRDGHPVEEDAQRAHRRLWEWFSRCRNAATPIKVWTMHLGTSHAPTRIRTWGLLLRRAAKRDRAG